MVAFRLPRADLEKFRAQLASQYKVLGPVARGNDVVFTEIQNAADLILSSRQSLLPPKKYFRPPTEKLFTFKDRQVTEIAEASSEQRAVIGIHPCDVNGMQILDRVFGDTYPDPYYQQLRKNTLIVAQNCTTPCANGFCTSFNTGPGATAGFDLALTDLGDNFLVEVGSEAGQALAAAAGLAEASEAEKQLAAHLISDCAAAMQPRKMAPADLPAFMLERVDHPHWQELKERCLACGSCTNVCPTCFCFDVKDPVDLSLTDGNRERTWDSCQYYKFSRVALDHIFRPDRAARVKQRLFHKLAYYQQQFETNGCVGCGRCVDTCIVKIDPVEVVAALHEGPAGQPAQQFKVKRRGICPSENPYTGHAAVLESVKPQTGDTATYRFVFKDEAQQRDFSYDPGTFNMLSIPGIGEAPISISSGSAEKGFVEHTIRSVGTLTNFLQKLEPGAAIDIRGPYGAGWPVEEAKGKNVLIVAGGIGLAPLRPVIKHIENNRADYGKLEILYGARNPDEMLFTDEYDAWRELPDTKLRLTVDNPTCSRSEWTGNVGVVTTLCNLLEVDPANTIVMTCGPGIMMKFAVKDLLNRGFKPEEIFVSLERRMSCGIKKCGNCQIGPLFVCQDGPVFRYSEVKAIPEDIF